LDGVAKLGVPWRVGLKRQLAVSANISVAQQVTRIGFKVSCGSSHGFEAANFSVL
jgi:hypothetical protein